MHPELCHAAVLDAEPDGCAPSTSDGARVVPLEWVPVSLSRA